MNQFKPIFLGAEKRDEAAFPQRFEIDYVRIYQKPDVRPAE